MSGLQRDERLAVNPDNHPLMLNNDSLMLFDQSRKRIIQGSAAQSCCALTLWACVRARVCVCVVYLWCAWQEKWNQPVLYRVSCCHRQAQPLLSDIPLCLVVYCDSILETSVQQRRQRLCPFGERAIIKVDRTCFPKTEHESSINWSHTVVYCFSTRLDGLFHFCAQQS